MTNQIYIVPRRNDLVGVGLTLTDLKPNAGQKSSVYDGQHQNVNLAESMDPTGVTVVNGVSYVSGSKNTTLTANAVVDDTTGTGNDVNAVAATTFGLAAYIKDRVHRAGITLLANGEMTFAECNAAAALIVADVLAGTTLDLARINVHLAATVAATDLTGASGNSVSFGSVEDIIRILSGEVYRLPQLTIIESVASAFQTQAQRNVFVAAQTPAQVASQGLFAASGSFLAASDAGYLPRPVLARTGALNASLLSGVLSHYKANMTILNTNSYAYTAGEVTAWKPRAQDIGGTVIPTTGISAPVTVYLNDGTVL